MASEDSASHDVWSRRALTIALWFAYTPAFLFSLQAIERALRAVREQHELWWLALYAMGSCVGVSLALVTLTVLTRWATARTQKRLFIFLLANWLPYTVVVWFWSFLEVRALRGAWID